MWVNGARERRGAWGKGKEFFPAPERLQNIGSVSPGAHSQKTGNMCHLQDGAKNCGTMKRYVLFFPSDIIAEVMCLEWISPNHARKINGQISLWDFSDARQIAIVLSVALSMRLMQRSCRLELTYTQWHQNLSGLFWGCGSEPIFAIRLIFLGVLYFLYYLWWTSEIHPPLRMRTSTTSTLGHLQWPEAYYFMMKFSLPWDNSGYNVSTHHEKSSISEPIKI